MDLSKMTPEEARAIVMQAQNVFDASIADQQRSTPKEIQALPLDLSVARTRANAMKVSFPFKSVLVEQATDLNTYIYLIPISNDSGNDPIRLGTKDIYKNEFGFRECYIYWDAQPNKTILLKFFVRSFLENGRLLLDQNSSTDYLSIGAGNCQNDGFTVICSLQNNIAISTSGVWTSNRLEVENDNSLYKDWVNSGIGIRPTFVVPEGYYAELVSAELNVTVAINSTNWQIHLFALPYNALQSAFSGSLNDFTPQRRARTFQGVTPLVKNEKIYFRAIPSNPEYSRMIIEENEGVVVSTANVSGVANPDGQCNIRMMFRLYKKVG